MRDIYLDNSATTRTIPEVREIMMTALDSQYGNPSAMHAKGLEAERLIRQAAEKIALTLKVEAKDIVFTSGGTESNNLALIGSMMARHRTGKHMITTKIEHASIANTAAFLEKQGFEVTYLDVDAEGRILLEQLEQAIRPDTVLVSIMMVNNEIGSIQPIEEIGALIKKVNPETLFHVDAIQAYGKLKIQPKRMKIDMLSVSGHKFHGPKGIGFLYIKNGVRINPIILGGGQQGAMRSGTENVPGIAGMGAAAEIMHTGLEEKTDRMYALRERLVRGLQEIEDVTINGPEGRACAPQVVSASFAGVRSEVLLHSLEAEGIYVSAGSACSSNGQKHPSATLTAIHLDKSLLDSTIRLSLSLFNTEEEIDETIEVLKKVLPKLRRFTRR